MITKGAEFERFMKSLYATLVSHRAAGEILHEAVNDEPRHPAVLTGHG